MGKITIISNPNKPAAKKFAKTIRRWAAKNKFPHPEFAVVLGGDGMMIKSARKLAKAGIPLLGVNLGKLGFLAEVSVKDLLPALDRVARGKYEIEERSMLNVEIHRKKKLIRKFLAMNDAVLKNGELARAIDLNIIINGRFVNDLVADGVIIATPTGSTAYCLAAGGPIVHPKTKALIAVPISPHSLTQRPLVVPDNEIFEIEVESGRNLTILSVDGQIHMRLKPGDIVKAGISKLKTKIIVFGQNDYFKVLKEKFKWGA